MVSKAIKEALEVVKRMCRDSQCKGCPFAFKLGDDYLCTLKGKPQDWVIDVTNLPSRAKD